MFNVLVTCEQPELVSILKIVKNILNFKFTTLGSVKLPYWMKHKVWKIMRIK